MFALAADYSLVRCLLQTYAGVIAALSCAVSIDSWRWP